MGYKSALFANDLSFLVFDLNRVCIQEFLLLWGQISKHLHSWKLRVHAENFVDSSILVIFQLTNIQKNHRNK